MISEQAEPAAAGGLRQVLRGWRLKNKGAKGRGQRAEGRKLESKKV